MKFFEKLGAPKIVYETPPTKSFGAFLYPDALDEEGRKILEKYKATKEGIIFIEPDPLKGEIEELKKEFRNYSKEDFKKMYDYQTKFMTDKTKKHELEHYRSFKEGDWSFRNYRRNALARIIEETAAYKTEGKFFKALKNALMDEFLEKSSGLKEEFERSPKGLLYVAPTGSGKTKAALEATRDKKTVAVTPASLTKNLEKEERKFFKKVTKRPTFTYAGLARGHKLPEAKNIILDESHNIRNPKTKSFKNTALQRWKYDKALLLSATPMYNEPFDIASQVNLVANKKILPMQKKEFYKKLYRDVEVRPGLWGKLRGVKPGKERKLKDPKAARQLLDRHTYVVGGDKFKNLMPGKKEEIVKVPMNPEQEELYKRVSKKMPYFLRYKIKKDMAPSKTEARNMNSYLMGVRQIANTTRGYTDKPVSPKFRKMIEDAQKELKSGGKVLMYSNFRGSGVEGLSERLKKHKIPHGMITGSLSKAQRLDEVKKYKTNKNKVLLYSGAGAEGLDLPSTTMVQIAEPYWNKARVDQAKARGIRRGAKHDVKVKKYISVFPEKKNFLGMKKKPKKSVDQYLLRMSNKKDKEISQLLEAIRDE